MLLLSLPFLGCAPIGSNPPLSRYMRPIQTPPPIVAEPSAATVVFIRPNKVVFGAVLPIVDENGHFYGNLAANHYMVARVAPGHHVFTSWVRYGGSEDSVQADLLAGRVYYVRAEVIDQGFSGHSQVTAIKPGSSEWTAVSSYVMQLTREEIDPSESGNVATMEADRKLGWGARMKDGLAHVAKLPPGDQAAHVLASSDADPAAR
jgi:hypothetical protein